MQDPVKRGVEVFSFDKLVKLGIDMVRKLEHVLPIPFLF